MRQRGEKNTEIGTQGFFSKRACASVWEPQREWENMGPLNLIFYTGTQQHTSRGLLFLRPDSCRQRFGQNFLLQCEKSHVGMWVCTHVFACIFSSIQLIWKKCNTPPTAVHGVPTPFDPQTLIWCEQIWEWPGEVRRDMIVKDDGNRKSGWVKKGRNYHNNHWTKKDVKFTCQNNLIGWSFLMLSGAGWTFFLKFCQLIMIFSKIGRNHLKVTIKTKTK